MKKLIAILLCAVTLLSLCACGQKSSENPAGSTETRTAALDGDAAASAVDLAAKPASDAALVSSSVDPAEPEETGSTPAGRKELVVGSTTPMTGAFATDAFGLNSADMDVRELIHGYELTGWDSAHSTFIINPTVVKNYTEVSGTYTITLRNDLKWSDGSAVTAWDYAFTVLLTSAPAVAELGGSTGAYGHIQGVDGYSNGKTNRISGVTVPDDYTLKITINREFRPHFFNLGLLGIKPYPIGEIAPGCSVKSGNKGIYLEGGELSKAVLEKNLLDPASGYATHPKVVSGPYILTDYDAQANKATFELNGNFKGDLKGKKPSIEKIVFRYIPSDKVTEEVKNGSVDLMNRVTAKDTIDELKKESGLTSAAYPRSGLAFISFCCEKPTVEAKAVRQAIAYCFDSKAFAKEIAGDYGEVPNGFYGKGQWMVMLINGSMNPPLGMTAAETAQLKGLSLNSITHYELDTGKAEKLLEKNGWKLGDDGIRFKKVGKDTVKLELVLAYPAGSHVADVFPDTLVENLDKIGVKLTLKAVEAADLYRQYYRQDERDCDMIFMATNFNTIYDPSENFALDPAHQTIYNRTAIKDKTLFDYAVQMRRTQPGDPVGYCVKWARFQNYLMSQAPIIPAYTNDYYDFYIPALKNYKPTSFQTWSKAIVEASLG